MSAERVALNDATFRDANERIEGKAESLGIDHVPFICQCADASCTEIIQLRLSEYEEIRADPTTSSTFPATTIGRPPLAKR